MKRAGPQVPGVVQAVEGDVIDAGAEFVACDDGIVDQAGAARGVVVAVDFVDGEFEFAVAAGQAEVSGARSPLGFLHGFVDGAGFVAGVDEITGVDQAARDLDGPAAGGVGDGGAG